MIRTGIFIVVFVLAFILNGQLAAEGIKQLTREQQIAEKLTLTADADEIISLKASAGRFIGLYKRANTSEIKSGEAHGVVILVHGMGAHPDWPDVISPLRTQLTEYGWSTLSIQMPILSPEEPIARYGKTLRLANSRIQAAVDYLHEWGVEPIILLGYSFGAAQAANYLASKKPEDIKAFISVSMLAQKFIRPGLDVYRFIGEIAIPILDIYAEEDLQDVRRGIDDRRLAASKNGNAEFQQIELQRSGHHYLGLEDALVEQIQIWLQNMMLVNDETIYISEISPEFLHERQ
jgi:predicted alpha/beta-hydrolase family hydrolase